MSHELNRAVGRLADRVAHWTPSRWAASSASGATHADVLYELIQRLADEAADAEGQPRRRVPRLDNSLAMPDQLRVIAADLVTAHPAAPILADLAQQVATTL